MIPEITPKQKEMLNISLAELKQENRGKIGVCICFSHIN